MKNKGMCASAARAEGRAIVLAGLAADKARAAKTAAEKPYDVLLEVGRVYSQMIRANSK